MLPVSSPAQIEVVSLKEGSIAGNRVGREGTRRRRGGLVPPPPSAGDSRTTTMIRIPPSI